MSSLDVWLLVALVCSLVALVWSIIQRNRARVSLRDIEASSPLSSTTISPHPIEPSATDNPDDMHVFSPLFLCVASSIDAGLIILDNDRHVLFLNPQAEELLGQKNTSREGHGLITLLRDYQAESLVSEVLRDRETREITIKPISSYRMLHLRCIPFQANGSSQGALLIMQDVTQISMLERARRDMVANVSHELRSPLSSLKLLVETLQSEPPQHIASRMLGQMIHEIDAVTQLANELHELSQIESGRVTLQLSPQDLQHVVQQAIQHIHPQASRKNIRVVSSTTTLKPVLIDARRISQVLINLLHNAVKFTPVDGTITLQTCEVTVHEKPVHTTPHGYHHTFRESLPSTETVQSLCAYEVVSETGELTTIPLPASHPPGVWALLSVEDTGIGIPSEDVPRIFERFYKVDRSRAYSGGTGLGLAIAKHLVEGHSGRLWVESVEGRGSTFYFTLPLA